MLRDIGLVVAAALTLLQLLVGGCLETLHGACLVGLYLEECLAAVLLAALVVRLYLCVVVSVCLCLCGQHVARVTLLHALLLSLLARSLRSA